MSKAAAHDVIHCCHRPVQDSTLNLKSLYSLPDRIYFLRIEIMDKTDRKILQLLQKDCTISVSDIAAQVNLSTTPCWKRIKRLEDEGVIKGRVALVDANKVRLGLSVFVHIKTRNHDSEWLEHFAREVVRFDEVIECYRMAGEWDYLLRVVVEDIAAFDAFYKTLVHRIDGLQDVTSSFSMEEMKNTTILPVR